MIMKLMERQNLFFRSARTIYISLAQSSHPYLSLALQRHPILENEIETKTDSFSTYRHLPFLF
jgi:hypothetical protein